MNIKQITHFLSTVPLKIYGMKGRWSASPESPGGEPVYAAHVLKPCPFCGEQDRLELANTHTASYWIECEACEATARDPKGSGNPYRTKAAAKKAHHQSMRRTIATWNRRA